MKTKSTFFVEFTDTFGGEANYSWVRRFIVSAKSIRGAVIKVNRELGYTGQLSACYNDGNSARHDIRGACLCLFTGYVDKAEACQIRANFSSIKEL